MRRGTDDDVVVAFIHTRIALGDTSGPVALMRRFRAGGGRCGTSRFLRHWWASEWMT